MIKIMIFLLMMHIPHTVFAECRLTGFEGKLEGICWGDNPMSPTTKKITQRTIKSKVNRESKVDAESVAMTNEELKYMIARNYQDGYRGKMKVAIK